jgi:ABC-2 type transport system permease protein
MLRYLRLWRRFVVLALVREAEYRASFALSVVEGFAELGVAVFTFGLLYQFTSGIAGWSAAQALTLVGTYRVLDGMIALQIAPNLTRMGDYIGQGDLDFILLRPVSSRFLVSFRWLRPSEAVNVLVGLILVVVAGRAANAQWSLLGILAAAVLAGCGLILLYCFWFAIVTGIFWLVRSEIHWLFYDAWQAARYPVDYFRGPVRAILTFALPVAFATTFPTRALLGDVPWQLIPAGVLLAAASLGVTQQFWGFALRHYSSASS